MGIFREDDFKPQLKNCPKIFLAVLDVFFTLPGTCNNDDQKNVNFGIFKNILRFYKSTQQVVVDDFFKFQNFILYFYF